MNIACNAFDLATHHPEQVKEPEELWQKWANTHQVFPKPGNDKGYKVFWDSSHSNFIAGFWVIGRNPAIPLFHANLLHHSPIYHDFWINLESSTSR